jgi:hypothetical protein
METEKLYSPLKLYIGDSPIAHEDAFEYMEDIERAMLSGREGMDSTRGLAEHIPDSLDDIVISLFPNIERHGDRLWCVADVTLSRPMTPGETGELTQWWEGQLTDVWGDDLEQRGIAVSRGNLYLQPWMVNDSYYFIATQKEFNRKMGYAAVCRNGELQPGDLVLSTADNDYACLVGTVTAIKKADTPEHGGGTPRNNIHVDFTLAEYTPNRLVEIDRMLGDLYGRPTTPGIWPPIDVDDAIMAPGMLYRITGIDRKDLAAILDSGENAAKYAEKLEATLKETPAQAALHEPDIYSDKETAALRDRLVRQLNGNLSEYLDTLSDHAMYDITGMSSEMAAMAGAHHYLTEIHNFHKSELEYLLKFQNPLQVVADAFEVSGIDDRSDIMWEIFDKQDALQSKYALVPQPKNPEVKAQLFERLDQNLSHSMAVYRDAITKPGLSNEELYNLAERITATNTACEYLKNGYSYEPGDIECMMRFQYPLQIVAASWPTNPAGLVGMDEVMHDLLEEMASHAERDFPPVLQESVSKTEPSRNMGVTPSVLEQIRQAREEAKNHPAPHKDAPGKGREPEL